MNASKLMNIFTEMFFFSLFYLPKFHFKKKGGKNFSSVAICSIGIFTSAMVGRLGDTKSRKLALLIPFTGLLLEGISLVVQSYYMEVSDLKKKKFQYLK